MPDPLPSALPALANFRFHLRTFLFHSETVSEAHGITAQQYQLLQVLGAAAVAGVSITLIAERMLLRHHSAVELVNRAALAGLILRGADPDDQRRVLIQMTTQGRRVLRQLVQEHIALLQQSGPILIDALRELLPPEARPC